MQRLNIFVDETGEFGFSKGTSELYGVSFTFHKKSNKFYKIITVVNTWIKEFNY